MGWAGLAFFLGKWAGLGWVGLEFSKKSKRFEGFPLALADFLYLELNQLDFFFTF